MAFTLKHKQSGKVFQVKEVTLIDLPYQTIPHDQFKIMDGDAKEWADQCIKESGPTSENKKAVVLATYEGLLATNGLVVFDSAVQWDVLVNYVKQGLIDGEWFNAETITDVAFSDSPVYVAGQSRVVDTRCHTPFEALPSYAVVYVSMIKRRDVWRPLAVGVSVCFHCGTKESETTKLKVCSKCKKSKYCCKECQLADWRTHKKDCK